MVDCKAKVMYLMWPYGKGEHKDCRVYSHQHELFKAVSTDFMDNMNEMIIEEVLFRRTLKIKEVKPPEFELNEVHQ